MDKTKENISEYDEAADENNHGTLNEAADENNHGTLNEAADENNNDSLHKNADMTETDTNRENSNAADNGIDTAEQPERLMPEKGDTIAMMIAMAVLFLPKALMAVGVFALVFWLLYKFWLHC